MTTVDIGPFRLIDPPPDQDEIIRGAIGAIDFPGERLTPALEGDPDGAVLVEWDDTGQGTSGLFYGYNLRIVLSTRTYHLDWGAAFVFAHEVGHLVDKATLTDEQRTQLISLWHEPGASGKYLGQEMNGEMHSWSHEQPHVEEWVANENEYLFRLNEAYADQFVAAFAPTIWNGSLHEDLGDRSTWNGRFVHWTEEHERVHAITLTDPPKPDPKEPVVRMRDIKDVTWKHPRAKWILRAVRLGLMDLNREGKFRPRRRMTRAQVAEALVKLHDKTN